MERRTMDDAELDTPEGDGRGWLPWLAIAWLGLLLLATIAELTGWDNLRLALDFQRHFR